MRDETFDKLRALCLLILAALVFLIVAVGVGWIISAKVEEEFGFTAVLALWALVAILSGIFFGWRMTLSTMKTVLAAYVEVQTADDAGEVNRQRVELEQAKANRSVLEATIWGVKQQQPALPAPAPPQYPALTADWSKAQLPVAAEWSDV